MRGVRIESGRSSWSERWTTLQADQLARRGQPLRGRAVLLSGVSGDPQSRFAGELQHVVAEVKFADFGVVEEAAQAEGLQGGGQEQALIEATLLEPREAVAEVMTRKCSFSRSRTRSDLVRNSFPDCLSCSGNDRWRPCETMEHRIVTAREELTDPLNVRWKPSGRNCCGNGPAGWRPGRRHPAGEFSGDQASPW